MTETRANAFDILGATRTLVGPELKAGDRAPNFSIVDMGMQPLTLESWPGKTLVLCSVPSLDTGTCSQEMNRFNQEALDLSDNIQVVSISMDLPFALKRWCQANQSDRLIAASDHRQRSFGERYGVLIEDLQLLSRAVFVVDAGGTLRYVEYVPAGGQLPDFDATLAAAKQAAG